MVAEGPPERVTAMREPLPCSSAANLDVRHHTTADVAAIPNWVELIREVSNVLRHAEHVERLGDEIDRRFEVARLDPGESARCLLGDKLVEPLEVAQRSPMSCVGQRLRSRTNYHWTDLPVGERCQPFDRTRNVGISAVTNHGKVIAPRDTCLSTAGED